jgi:predicted AAA+ superfamily ATPase
MKKATFIPRRIETRIAEALLDTAAVSLAGLRQAGKTTLMGKWQTTGGSDLGMDAEFPLLSAREDPVGMIRSLDRAVIDEIQRVPQLLMAIKKSVEENRRLGRFSADWFGQPDDTSSRGQLTRRMDENHVAVAFVAERHRVALGELD